MSIIVPGNNPLKMLLKLENPLPPIQPQDKTIFYLEDQFILRLPLDEAKYIRNLLKEKPKKIKKALQIQLEDDMKHGTVYVRKKPFVAKLVSLPAIIESCKSFNRVNIYKTGSISQMLVCTEKEKENKEGGGEDPKEFLWPHGITPPMKNVRKQRFRKTMRNQVDVKEVADVQKEVSLLLRTDYGAVSSRFEIIKCTLPPVNIMKYKKKSITISNDEITEEMLFGTLSSSESDEDRASYDIMEFNN